MPKMIKMGFLREGHHNVKIGLLFKANRAILKEAIIMLLPLMRI